MASNQNSFADFTRKYSLSKTLRFSLRPMGSTAEQIQKKGIIGTKENNGVQEPQGQDATRAKNYKIMKCMLDVLHRNFIADTLDATNIKKIFSTQDIKNVYKVWEQTKSKAEENNLEASKKLQLKKSRLKEFQKAQKAQAKKLSESFDQTAVQLKHKYKTILENKKNDKQKEPTNEEKTTVKLIFSEAIFQIMNENIKEGVYEKEENKIYEDEKNKKDHYGKEKLENICNSFNKFHTYFTGFQNNRENVYNTSGNQDELLHTSIAHRLFATNLIFHFENIRNWKKIKESIKNDKAVLKENNWDFANEIKEIELQFSIKIEDFFRPEAFLDFFAQKGIDFYNQILGGLPEEVNKKKIQGLNEKINLSRQKTKNENRHSYPRLEQLQKQILSKNDNTFIDEFIDDKTMFEAIHDFHQEAVGDASCTKLKQFYNELETYLQTLSEDESKEHIIDSKNISNISMDLYNEWNIIEQWWKKYLDHSQIKHNKAKRTQPVSFFEIQKLLLYMLDEKEAPRPKKYWQKRHKEWERDELENFWTNYISYKLDDLINKEDDTDTPGIALAWEKLNKSDVLKMENLSKDREKEKDTGYEQVTVIKDYLDSCLAVFGFLRSLQAKEQAETFSLLLKRFTNDFNVVKLYNKVRNRITKKTYSLEKIKVNFQNATLLAGWDKNKETANLVVLLEKDNLFYLGIMTKKHNKIFTDIPEAALKPSDKTCYKKMIYKFIPSPNKMLPKVFFSKKGLPIYKPSTEIVKIKNEKLYTKEKEDKKSLKNFIDFLIKSLTKHQEWNEFFSFDKHNFMAVENYEDISEFYSEVSDISYKLSFTDISEDYINEKVAAGELYLFQIYNKDFSQNKKDKTKKDNLHTLYWKSLFMKENLKNVVTKLNGEAEIFFRPASINYTAEKLKDGHHPKKLKGKFAYPIIKDRRFSKNQYQFHVPITLNYNKPNPNNYSYNQKINKMLVKDLDKINIIGIDRGEKHLLYYSVINQQGLTLEQKSLNTITNKTKEVNYQEKLDKKEKERQEARKNWSLIENIKELKSGYLSQVVHELAKLIIKYNAIVVLEDLNFGFKRSRFKFEKQVYQKFEKALIDKLNYLVFKEENNYEKAGHYLCAYQLTAPFESFEKLQKQSGILFYTTASHTSNIDPISGFLKNIYFSYTKEKDAQDFWRKFEKIYYDEAKDAFAFFYLLDKITSSQVQRGKYKEKAPQKNDWTVYSCVERSLYDPKKKSSSKYNVHDKIKDLFENKKHNIEFPDNKCIKEEIANINDTHFHKELIHYFNSIMNLRVLIHDKTTTKDDDSNEATKINDSNDFILSPVEPFFDSRKAKAELPQNGDANGAYNIARKGICILTQMKKNAKEDPEKIKLGPISKQIWQDYTQSEEVVKQQRKKYNKDR